MQRTLLRGQLSCYIVKLKYVENDTGKLYFAAVGWLFLRALGLDLPLASFDTIVGASIFEFCAGWVAACENSASLAGHVGLLLSRGCLRT